MSSWLNIVYPATVYLLQLQSKTRVKRFDSLRNNSSLDWLFIWQWGVIFTMKKKISWHHYNHPLNQSILEEETEPIQEDLRNL